MTFQKGNKLGKGRPKRGKEILSLVRDKLIKTLYKRMRSPVFWESLTSTELLKAGLALMPKENIHKIIPDIQYLTGSVPRPELTVITDSIDEPMPSHGIGNGINHGIANGKANGITNGKGTVSQ